MQRMGIDYKAYQQTLKENEAFNEWDDRNNDKDEEFNEYLEEKFENDQFQQDI